jgi:hypothetical protein
MGNRDGSHIPSDKDEGAGKGYRASSSKSQPQKRKAQGQESDGPIGRRLKKRKEEADTDLPPSTTESDQEVEEVASIKPDPKETEDKGDDVKMGESVGEIREIYNLMINTQSQVVSENVEHHYPLIFANWRDINEIRSMAVRGEVIIMTAVFVGDQPNRYVVKDPRTKNEVDFRDYDSVKDFFKAQLGVTVLNISSPMGPLPNNRVWLLELAEGSLAWWNQQRARSQGIDLRNPIGLAPGHTIQLWAMPRQILTLAVLGFVEDAEMVDDFDIMEAISTSTLESIGARWMRATDEPPEVRGGKTFLIHLKEKMLDLNFQGHFPVVILDCAGRTLYLQTVLPCKTCGRYLTLPGGLCHLFQLYKEHPPNALQWQIKDGTIITTPTPPPPPPPVSEPEPSVVEGKLTKKQRRKPKAA